MVLQMDNGGSASTGAPARNPHSLSVWFAQRAERTPEQRALVFEGREWTYRELQADIDRLATLLSDGGLKAGDRLVYLGFNHPSYFITLFATAKLGGIFVPLNWRLTGPELDYIINDAKPHTILAGIEHVDLIESIRAGICGERFWCAHGDATGKGDWPSLEEALSRQEIRPIPHALRAQDDVALLMYTSGTTGRPKGAMITHGNLWNTAVFDLYTIDLRAADKVLLASPLFHIGALTVMTLTTFLKGACLILHRNFDPGQVLQDIELHKVNAFGGVAAMLAAVMGHPRFAKTDISSLRMLITGGAPCPKPILEFFAERNIHVMQGYGLTESTGTTAFLTSEFAAAKLGSVGKPDLAMEICIVDAEGRLIDQPHAPGEIYIRGPRVVLGYWSKPEATAEAIDVDGWLHTGDIGYRDEDGFLFISDRSKDMILSGGENIYSAEVESVLFGHPAIAEVAVVGMADARWGEIPVAVFALAEGQSLSLPELQQFAGSSLARYKIPAKMLVVPSLPRNPAGKVLKYQLRELVVEILSPAKEEVSPVRAPA